MVRRKTPVNSPCPSSPRKQRSVLLGIVLADGTVDFATYRNVAYLGFDPNATREGTNPPEPRLHFSSPSAQRARPQWAGPRYGVSDACYHPDNSSPTACSIRLDSRWFQQTAAVTDIAVTETRV